MKSRLTFSWLYYCFKNSQNCLYAVQTTSPAHPRDATEEEQIILKSRGRVFQEGETEILKPCMNLRSLRNWKKAIIVAKE